MLDTIHHADCFDVFPSIPDGSVDMVLADLPFGQTRNPWDKPLDLAKLWRSYHRIVKKDGAIVLCCQGMFTADLMVSNRKHWRYNYAWVKSHPTGFLNADKQPLREHEDIAVFYRKPPPYHPQFWEGDAQHMRTVARHVNHNYGSFEREPEAGGNTRKHPRSTLYFPEPWPARHPTQKPVELFAWLVSTYTDPGQVVLDNTAGIGTTAIACKLTGRHFIAIELHEPYVTMARADLAAFDGAPIVLPSSRRPKPELPGQLSMFDLAEAL